jgi:hypothetical protein
LSWRSYCWTKLWSLGLYFSYIKNLETIPIL